MDMPRLCVPGWGSLPYPPAPSWRATSDAFTISDGSVVDNSPAGRFTTYIRIRKPVVPGATVEVHLGFDLDLRLPFAISQACSGIGNTEFRPVRYAGSGNRSVRLQFPQGYQGTANGAPQYIVLTGITGLGKLTGACYPLEDPDAGGNNWQGGAVQGSPFADWAGWQEGDPGRYTPEAPKPVA